MTTYANIKLNEVFALYGNPFTRGSFKKNFNEKITKKHYNKVNFDEEKSFEIKQESIIDENSHINLLNNNNENNLLTLNKKKLSIKLEKSLNKKISITKLNLNTDAFSMNSHKKRTQQELIKKIYIFSELIFPIFFIFLNAEDILVLSPYSSKEKLPNVFLINSFPSNY